jgi:hypothetical protein
LSGWINDRLQWIVLVVLPVRNNIFQQSMQEERQEKECMQYIYSQYPRRWFFVNIKMLEISSETRCNRQFQAPDSK